MSTRLLHYRRGEQCAHKSLWVAPAATSVTFSQIRSVPEGVASPEVWQDCGSSEMSVLLVSTNDSMRRPIGAGPQMSWQPVSTSFNHEVTVAHRWIFSASLTVAPSVGRGWH